MLVTLTGLQTAYLVCVWQCSSWLYVYRVHMSIQYVWVTKDCSFLHMNSLLSYLVPLPIDQLVCGPAGPELDRFSAKIQMDIQVTLNQLQREEISLEMRKYLM